jgi:HEAT repeat protein
MRAWAAIAAAVLSAAAGAGGLLALGRERPRPGAIEALVEAPIPERPPGPGPAAPALDRARAYDAAAAAGSPAGVRALAREAEDPAAGAQAAAALGRVTSRGAATALVEVMNGRAPGIARANAARALGAAGGAAEAAALADAVEDAAGPPRLRQEAALALGRIATEEEVRRLVRVLRGSVGDRRADAVQLRAAVLQALATAGPPEAAEALRAYAADGPADERPLARWLLARGTGGR